MLFVVTCSSWWKAKTLSTFMWHYKTLTDADELPITAFTYNTFSWNKSDSTDDIP